MKFINVLSITSENLKGMIEFHFNSKIFYSLVIMLLLVIFSIIIGIKFNKASKDPLGEQKGIVFLISAFINKIESLIKENMGEKHLNLTFYFFAMIPYLFIAFVFGLTGLSSPFTYIVMPLSISLCSFILIHFNALKEQKMSYFRRFIDPIPLFLPINLFTFWSTLLSFTLRLFGNALSGYCIMAVVYAGLEALSGSIFRPLFNITSTSISGVDIIIAPFITPILHLYFDLFSGFIQTLVFSLLSMIFIAQEDVDTEEVKLVSKEQLS